MTDKTILDYFWKSGISVEAQTGTMNDHDDPFKEIMDNDMDDSAVESTAVESFRPESTSQH